MNLDNSNRRLLEGLVLLLRDEVNGWSYNPDYDVDNVWSKNVPTEANEQFPRGVVDITAGSDFDLSVDLDVRLREVFVKVTVFGKSALDVESLIDSAETALLSFDDDQAQTPKNEWDNNEYLGDWSIREVDGFTQMVENEEIEGKLRYNRSVDIVAEVIKTNY